MRARGLAVIGLIGLIGALGACGSSDDTATVATRPTAPIPPATSTTMTTPTTTAAPTTSSAAPTTSSAAPTTSSTPPPTTTTVQASTTVAPSTAAPAGVWQTVEFAPAATPVGYSGNWEGTPSPAAPAAGDALADGYYAATLVAPWDPASPTVLHAELRRFGYCRDLPADTCSPNPDATDELGFDPSWTLPVDIPLDASTRVVVDGFACEREVKQASGADLADLFTAFEAAYNGVIAPQVLAGVQDLEIATSLGGATVRGFVADEALCPGQNAGVMHFQQGDAPSLLLQVLLRYTADGPPELLRPSDVAVLNGVQVTGGVPTYYFYAGYAS